MESFIDSKPLLESLASTRIVENKFLVSEVNAMNTLIEDGSVKSFTWVHTENELADILTKDMVEPLDFRSLFLRNKWDFKRFLNNPRAVLKIHDNNTEDVSKEIRLENNEKF